MDVEQKPLKPVRSFVKRVGRITKSQRTALQEGQARFIITTTQIPELHPLEWFEQDQPLVLEIGFGMGENLIHQAKLHPEWNFLGIDVHDPGLGACCAEGLKHDMQNVRLICGDAIEMLEKTHGTPISQAFILFPDPWPKKKHHKRRLIQSEFIRLLAKRMPPQAKLHIMTDWADYAEHIEQVMQGIAEFASIPWTDCEFAQTRITTKFEAKGLKKGHTIQAFAYQRTEWMSSVC